MSRWNWKKNKSKRKKENVRLRLEEEFSLQSNPVAWWCDRSKHNVRILLDLMQEFEIVFPPDQSARTSNLQRLAVFEVIVTVLLEHQASSEKPLNHGMVISYGSKLTDYYLTKCSLSSKKIQKTYKWLYPIIQTKPQRKGFVFLSDFMLKRLSMGEDKLWTLKQADPVVDSSEPEVGSSCADVNGDKQTNEADSVLDGDSHDRDDVDDNGGRARAVKRPAESSSSTPPTKVARVDPVCRRTGVKAPVCSGYPKTKNKYTITKHSRMDMWPRKVHKNTSTEGFDCKDEEPEYPRWGLFHCEICHRVPDDHVVMDARCGALVACLHCLKPRKEYKNVCPRCGGKSKYIVLKYLCEKLQELDCDKQ